MKREEMINMSEQQQDELLQKIGAMLNAQQEQLRNEMRQNNEKVQTQIDKIQIQIDTMKEQYDDLRTEMRDRDNQRHAEIIALQTKTDARFESLETKIDGISKHVQNLTTAAMVGIGAMVVGMGGIAAAVIAFVYSVVTKN